MTHDDADIATNFIHAVIEDDLAKQRLDGPVRTRFPPEPNGYLHIGHAKSICLNFSTADKYHGSCNLRFDDTNPEKESAEFQDAIKDDVHWLGFQWEGEPRHASDYFPALYEYAVDLIKQGKAYVDSLGAEEIREYRGSLTNPGRDSPYRDRTVEENLALFAAMADGKYADGEHVLRAKIDMASPNMNMRDPTLYRIRKAHHHRTGNEWKIFPMYDYTHCVSDALERVTHSLCTLEFEDHRPLYDWVLDQLDVPCHPQQIEFARLELSYTITSKRKLQQLVSESRVDGWDDPRLPTLRGMRRRGYPPAAIREFCSRVGVTKKETTIDAAALETCVREHLDHCAPRVMAVLDPIKVIITNYPADKSETLTVRNHPKDESFGSRELEFSREVFIERDDFAEQPPKKFFRLAPGKEVRLRNAYAITCNKIIKDATTGQIKEIHCTYDPESGGGKTADGRKIKGIIHWVSAASAIDAEVRNYDRLFDVPNPAAAENFFHHINPDSVVILRAKIEPSLANAAPESVFQFERIGYFCADQKDHQPSSPVFNRTVTLRDTWAKIQAAN